MRGHVRKRSTWEFIVDIGRHPVTGRRRQKSQGGFATKREAESTLHEFIRYMEGGGDPCPERISLVDYVAHWLEYQRARGIRPRTLEGYEGYIRREILPLIGGVELPKLRPGHVRTVLNRMQQRGLSTATIAQVRWVLGSALRQAVEDGLIAANPVSAVKRPRVRRAELIWPTPMQLAALLEVSRGTVWEVPVLLATVTGARRSEVLGISWQDVDLRTGTIYIRRGIHPRPHARDAVAFTPLKTKRSHRQVQLPPFALERIRRHRREQLGRRTALGSAWEDPLDAQRQLHNPSVRPRGRVAPVSGLLHPRVQATRPSGGTPSLHPPARRPPRSGHGARPARRPSGNRLGRARARLPGVHRVGLSARVARGGR
jgi:integrase